MSEEAFIFTSVSVYFQGCNGLKLNGRKDRYLFEWLQWKAIFLISGDY